MQVSSVVKFDKGHLLCPRHALPFAEASQREMESLHHHFDLWVTNGAEGLMEAALEDLNLLKSHLTMIPFCCRLPKEALVELYGRTGLGSKSPCQHCKKVDVGSPIQYKKANGIIATMSHLCFRCLVFKTFTLQG